jgi:hypothetical protein
LKKFEYKGGEEYMTTIVNNPPPSNDSNGGVGMIVGLVILVVLAYLVIVYGLPAIKQIGSPQINIPGKIDVNVQQTK